MRLRKIIALMLLAAMPAAAQIVPPPADGWTCRGNIVQNPQFNGTRVADGSLGNGSTAPPWVAAYGSPQLVTEAGCHDPNFMTFWGNQVVGEAVKQPVAFVKGHVYDVSFCGRFRKGPQPSVNIVLRASIGGLPSPACSGSNCATIFTTPAITSTTWQTFNTCFTAAENFDTLTVSPSNGLAINDGGKVSWGDVDDVCIRDITPAIDGPANTCTSPATYCVKPPATGPFSWSVTGGTATPIGNGSCALVTWFGSGGTIKVTSTVQNCSVTSTLGVRDCPHGNCCLDNPLKVTTGPVTHAGGGVYNFTATLTPALPAWTVKASIVSATRSFLPSSCSTAGPIAVTAAPTQPPSPPGFTSPPTVPLSGGNTIVWQSTSTAGGPLGAFPIAVQLPPPTQCTEVITICVEFQVTSGMANGQCRTCSVVRCFTFTRKGLDIVPTDGPQSADTNVHTD